MSTTPQTDAFVSHMAEQFRDSDWEEFARDFERELAALTSERDQLRAELAEMHKSFAGNVHTENRVLQTELAAERARLDWLESDVGMDWQCDNFAGGFVYRAKVDTAMKEAGK